MSIHNICFQEEIRISFPGYALLSGAMILLTVTECVFYLF